jgi:hypothetical protein
MEVIVSDQEAAVVGDVLGRHAFDQLFRRDALGLRLDHHRRAVRVFGAYVHAVVTLHALEPHPDVGLHGFDDVAEMQRAVGIGQGAGDEDLARHVLPGPEKMARKYKRSGPGSRQAGGLAIAARP